MELVGKLKQDLRRIYGANDPMNYIEDIRAETNPDTAQEELVVRLRVPRHYEKYIPEVYITSSSPFAVDHWAIQQARMMDAISRPLTARVDNSTRFVKPERVYFNGNHTTVVWPGGEKTIVGLGPDTPYDEYAGFCAAIVKKLFGSSREAEKFMNKIKIVQKKKAKKSKEVLTDVE